MHPWHILSPLLLGLASLQFAVGQSALSTNSGIDSADTWVTVDLTISSSGSATFSSPIYLASTGTSSSTLTVNPLARTMHVEAGYDSSGGIVMNLWPSGTQVNGENTDASTVGSIRYAGGQLTLFDQSGNPLSVTLPNSGMSLSGPLSLLGSNPGPSVIGGLVVPNIQNQASAMSAALSISGATAALQLPSSKTGSAAWSYVQSGANWILNQVTITPALSNGAATRTIQFANINWHDNSTNDAARGAVASTVKAPPAQVTSSPGSLPAPASDPAPVAVASIVDPANCNSNHYAIGGSQNVALIHGINSSSCAWTRMANWLNQDFSFKDEEIPTLASTWGNSGGITAQGLQTYSVINGGVNDGAGGTNFIVLGHSMGGLAARYAAQYFQYQQSTTGTPSLIRGVVTVDSPNKGANMAESLQVFTTVGFDELGFWLWDTAGCYEATDNPACWLADMLWVAGGVGSELAWSAINQSLVDMTPGSAFLAGLNGNALNGGAQEKFLQAAVIGHTPQRWAVVRWLDNFLAGMLWCPGPNNYCCNPEDACGERAMVQATEYFYDALMAALIILEFEEMTYCDAMYGNPYCQPPQQLAEAINWIAGILSWMDFADYLWNEAVDAPGDGTSDALVQGPSQYYPASTASQYLISPSDSHSGALKSSYDHTVLYNILSTPPFSVGTQASCGFGVSNSPDTLGAGGGSGSFAVTTTPTCGWSAASNASWISVTSGPNGVGDGTVSFSVTANPFTVPRTGNIQVGNDFSSTPFTVNQAGACIYSFSEGPKIVVPSAGASSTVQVYTGTDCVWSAVPAESWLTITSGASGTGSGAFAWNAAANTTGLDRTGTIQVGNQTLTFVDGGTAGTPGAGSVTIQGGPESYTYDACPSQYDQGCPVTIPETGSVTIVVGGQSFTYSYSPSDTASSIATTLANQMNYAFSPILAAVSGSKIEITSVINGASTNYSLSTSSTFNPTCNTDYSGVKHCFQSPAFVASASGSSLTGGTN